MYDTSANVEYFQNIKSELAKDIIDLNNNGIHYYGELGILTET